MSFQEASDFRQDESYDDQVGNQQEIPEEVLYSDDERDPDYIDEDQLNIQEEGTNEVVPESSNRAYIYNVRRKKSKSTKRRSVDWVSSLDSLTEAKLRRTTCCKQLRCFREVDYGFFIDRCRVILSSSAAVRRNILISMRDSDHDFTFNNRKVCIRFMKKSFHFSTHMMALHRVKSTNTNASVNGNVSSNHHYSSSSLSSSNSSFSGGFYRRSPQKDAIISFLCRLAEDCSDKMPDVDELHLPFFRKHEVYRLFRVE